MSWVWGIAKKEIGRKEKEKRSKDQNHSSRFQEESGFQNCSRTEMLNHQTNLNLNNLKQGRVREKT
jgi:hypothetical protein